MHTYSFLHWLCLCLVWVHWYLFTSLYPLESGTLFLNLVAHAHVCCSSLVWKFWNLPPPQTWCLYLFSIWSSVNCCMMEVELFWRSVFLHYSACLNKNCFIFSVCHTSGFFSLHRPLENCVLALDPSCDNELINVEFYNLSFSCFSIY